MSKRMPEAIVSPDTGRPDIEKAVGEAAVYAYTSIAGQSFLTKPCRPTDNTRGKMVWRLRCCGIISGLMLTKLQEEHDVYVDDRDGSNTGVEGLVHHVYIGFRGCNYAADPTWQQFAGDDLDPSAPLVIAGPREMIVEQLRRYGITDANVLVLWSPPVEE